MTTDLVTTLDTLSDYVGLRASRLQAAYASDRPDAVAALARLRRALGVGVEINVDVWDLFDADSPIPEELLGRGDAPSSAELAAVAALSVFARHQQSRRDTPMHRAGRQHSWGRAIASLASLTPGPGVERRFRALTRADDLAGALPHLRGLVSQLRAERIPLDYGRLAVDFFLLQHPQSVHGVRVRWTRDFHRRSTTTDATAEAGTDPTGDPQ